VIAELGGDVVVVAPNQLGVVNQVCLTMSALSKAGTNRRRVVLMGQEEADISAESNAELLEEVLWGANRAGKAEKRVTEGHKNILELPFLGRKPLIGSHLEKSIKKSKKVLQALAGKLP
jgi:dethiobiotin synthetase